MLNIFKSNHFELPFDPELAIYKVEAQGDTEQYLNIRVSSGDHANVNKNIKIESKDIQEISLQVKDLNGYSQSSSSPNTKQIEFKSALLIKRHSGEEEEVLLADHKILIEGIYQATLPSTPTLLQKITNKFKGAKTLTWPTFAEVEQEINEIWQDEFSIALDGYLGLGQNTPSKKRANTKKEKSSLLGKILNLGIIASVTYIVIVFGLNVINKNNVPQVQNTALEVLSPEALMKQAEADNVTNSFSNKKDDNSLESEILAEFGLEEGINLDQ